MHSKEAEVVEFVADCSCDGPVEVWLQNVVDSMKQALIVEFRKAIPTYDEMPRTSWLYKYSAQNTVVVSRTFFTQEVNEAFDDLEEGGCLRRGWGWGTETERVIHACLVRDAAYLRMLLAPHAKGSGVGGTRPDPTQHPDDRPCYCRRFSQYSHALCFLYLSNCTVTKRPP